MSATRVLGRVGAGWTLRAALEQMPAGVADVWIHAEALERLELEGRAPASFFEQERTGAAPLRVHVPAWAAGQPWADCATPEELRAALAAFEGAVGVPWRINGGVTSDRLLVELRDAQGNRKAWLPASDQPPEEIDAAELDAHVLSPRAVPAEGRYVHGFDLNAAYLGACGSLELGAGALEHVERPRVDMVALPGWWRLEGEQRFRASPSILYELERGGCVVRFTVAEGYYWPRHGRYLRAWQERLRDARRQLREKPPLENRPNVALEALKQVYTAGIGRLASRRRPNLRSPLFQPAWRAAVVANARVNLFRRIRKIEAASRARPALVWADAVYYVTAEPDAAAYARSIGLTLGAGLGQFKILGTVEGLDREVNASRNSRVERPTTIRAALTGENPNTARLALWAAGL